MTTRAAYYVRFSSEEQEGSNSIELQTRTCRAAIEREGWQLPPEHAFVDRARSGTTQAGREGLQALLHAAQAKAFDVVVVYKFDRLGRNFVETLTLLQDLERLGIRVTSATEGGTPLVRNILLSVADDYSRQLGKVVRDGMRETALAGYSTGGAPPYGYRRHEILDAEKRDRRGQPIRKVLWVVEEAKAPVVRQIFSRYLEGKGFKRIAMALNEEGLPGPCGGTWAPSAIREILHNPTYAGLRAFGRVRKVRLPTGRRSKRPRPEAEWTVVPNAHPAIVTLDLWQRVQGLLAAAARKHHPSLGATRRARSVYPLVGLVKCGVCRANFTVDRRHNGYGRMYEDYVCNSRKTRGKTVCANGTRLPRARLDAQITGLLKHRLLDPGTRETLRARAEALRSRTTEEAQRTRPAFQRELAKLDRKVANLVEHLTDLPPHAARSVREKLEDLSREREKVQTQLREADRVVRAADLLLLALGGSRYRLLIPTSNPAKRSRIFGRVAERILADLEASAPEAVRRQLKALVREVTIHPDGRVTVEGTWEPLVSEGMIQDGRALKATPEEVREMLVPGEGVEPSWGRMGGGIEPRLYRSARAHGGYRMAQSVGGRWVVEGKWVKESQQFPSEHLDFQVVADTNSHQMHYSVATLDRPSPRHRQPEPCPPWSPWRRSWSS